MSKSDTTPKPGVLKAFLENTPVAAVCPVCGGFRSLSREDGQPVCRSTGACFLALLLEVTPRG